MIRWCVIVALLVVMSACSPPVMAQEPVPAGDVIDTLIRNVLWQINALNWEYVLMQADIVEAQHWKDVWGTVLKEIDASVGEDALMLAKQNYATWANKLFTLQARESEIVSQLSQLWNLHARLVAMRAAP